MLEFIHNIEENGFFTSIRCVHLQCLGHKVVISQLKALLLENGMYKSEHQKNCTNTKMKLKLGKDIKEKKGSNTLES